MAGLRRDFREARGEEALEACRKVAVAALLKGLLLCERVSLLQACGFSFEDSCQWWKKDLLESLGDGL